MNFFREIFKRHPDNPILTAEDVPYPSTLVFNAGVTRYQGRYVMVFRNDYGGQPGSDQFEGTNLGLAFSKDGVKWDLDPEPWMAWRTEEIHRVYDPRLTVVEGRCYICFAVDTLHGIRGGVAVTDDFEGWDVLNLSVPDNRNMVLFPQRRNGKLMRLERPFPIYGRGKPERFDIWYSDSADGRYWGEHRLVLGSEKVPWANAKIGPGAPPIKTEQGWLTFFHAVTINPDVELPAWHPNWHKTYTVGMMLLDLEKPREVKALHPEPVMTPKAPYELDGFRGHVLFPGGAILEADGEIKLYYGAADTSVCLASCHVETLLGLFDQ